MPFEKGKSGNPKGRRPGAPNKSTASVKAALSEAFEKRGGVKALLAWAKKEPTEFYKLWAKMLPTDVEAKFSGKIEVAWTDLWTVGDARQAALAGSN